MSIFPKKEYNISLSEHLEDLRWHIIRSLIYLTVFSIVTYSCFVYVWYFVMQPISEIILKAKEFNIVVKLITTELTENFLLRMKISFFTGFIFSIPLISWEFLRFIIPAFAKKNRKKFYWILFFSVILFWSGILCTRFIIWPQLNSFFIIKWAIPSFFMGGEVIATEIHLTMKQYLSLFFSFHLLLGLFFQIPIVSIILAYLKVLNFSFFLKQWRYSFLIIAVTSATITPPDIFSMFAFMLPLFFLYIISAFLVFLINRDKK